MARPPSRARTEIFVERCRAAALAVTPQRLAIFRQLAATDRHPSAEELHAAVRREMPTLSLATVYKTLDTLAGIGAVRPVSRLGARGRWDANLEPHHHLICTACGAVSDVTEPALDAAAGPARRVAARHGFAAAGHAVEIFGRCAACRRARPASPAPRRSGRESQMAETMTGGLKLGQRVPDFELTTYEPTKGDFGKFSLKDQLANKRWTILFFYPADFTFV